MPWWGVLLRKSLGAALPGLQRVLDLSSCRPASQPLSSSAWLYLRHALPLLPPYHPSPRLQAPAYFTGSEVRMRDPDQPNMQFAVAFKGASWTDPDSVPLMVMQASAGGGGIGCCRLVAWGSRSADRGWLLLRRW